jgi:hypothetical protein
VGAAGSRPCMRRTGVEILLGSFPPAHKAFTIAPLGPLSQMYTAHIPHRRGQITSSSYHKQLRQFAHAISLIADHIITLTPSDGAIGPIGTMGSIKFIYWIRLRARNIGRVTQVSPGGAFGCLARYLMCGTKMMIFRAVKVSSGVPSRQDGM